MSWLFDRLCDIAVADEVEIVVSAAVLDPQRRDGSADLAEVIARAAAVPQLTVTFLPSDLAPVSTMGSVIRTVDLDELPSGAAIRAISVAIHEQQTAPRTALRVLTDTIRLHDVDDRRLQGFRDGGRRVVFATDAPGWSDRLRDAGASGLGIAVGGVDPAAQVRVDDFIGVVSILDALITLRMFAFGGRAADGAEAEPAMALRRVV